jgi:hypothetical protein
MEVVFGWFLDGPCYPETVSGFPATFNSAVCGPAKLLNILETALGLGAPAAGRAARVGEYLCKLQACDEGEFFFSRSLEIDPWATAQELLELRDQLIAGGWDLGRVPGNQKIAALRAVELVGDITLGPAERLILVIRELSRRTRSPIKKLTVASDLDAMPLLWRNCIEALVKSGTDFHSLSQSAIQSDTQKDLAKFQTAYSEGRSTKDLKGDGTLTFIDADDEIQASELTAAWIASIKRSQDLVIIRSDSISILDESLSRLGQPRIGSTTESPHRSLLQLLPLALELIWSPFDAARALEFLSIDGGPMPPSLTWYLKDAIRKQPGYGGALWNDAWTSITNERRAQLEKRGKIELKKLDAAAMDDVNRWKEWFQPVAQRDDVVKASFIEVVCRRVEAWATKRASVETGHGFYEIARNHAATLGKILTHYSTRVMTLHQLRSMVESVISEGAVSNFTDSEAAPWTTVDHPGQIWQPARTILWWDFTNTSASSIRRSRWTDAELVALSEHGVQIDTPAKQAKRESDAWRSALLNCSERFVIVKPRSTNGKQVTAHPAADELAAVLDKTSHYNCTVKASNLFLQESISVANEVISCKPVQPRKLPGPLREWTVSPNTINRREVESFTSIDRLLGCSLAWTMQYPAKMRSGVNWSLSEGEKLTGELAHKVIAHLLTESKNWTPADAAKRAAQLIDELLPTIASSLLLPGAAAQLRKAKDSIRRSVMHLVHLIKEGQLKVVGPEYPIEGEFLDGKLAGSIDLLLEDKNDNRVVIDLKWSHYARSYRTKIQDGKALQLAAYTSVVSAPGASFLAGYYLLRQSLLYFNAPEPFPRYTYVASAKSLEDTWGLAAAEYANTMMLLTTGRINATGIESDDNSNNHDPLVEPPCGYCDFNTFCGKRVLQ